MKKDRMYNIGIIVLLIAISVVIYTRFIASRYPNDAVSIKNIDNLLVFDTSGREIKFSNLMKKGESTFLFLFAMDDCYSCIFKGIQDLIQLKKDNKNTLALVIHELIDEVEGWSAKQDFSPFFMIKKTTFYERIKTSMTPVMIKMTGGKIESFRYIKP